MKAYLIILSFTFTLISCSQSKKVVSSISCANTFNLQYDKTSSKGVMAKRSQKKVTIFFLNSFHDSIKVYINGVLKFDNVVVTDSVSVKSDKSFTYEYSNNSNIPIIKVENKEGNCFDLKVKKRYKLIYVFYDSSKKWTVRFSNKYYVDN